jgi:heterodisulfide reductase subunit B
MAKIAYYPGCSGQSTSLEYDLSTRAVCRALGVELVDVADWSCCGSTPAHTVNHVLSAALSARNLALVEQQGMDVVTTPCPSC